MARIQFAAEVEEILGKLAGSVFQDSYGGFQIRGWSKPRNPQTQLSQLRRGDFRFMSTAWRMLTPTEQASWIAATGTVPEALRLFIGNNINLILIGEPMVSTYVPATVPDGLELLITALNNTVFDVIATGAITTVPSGCKLLLMATTDKFTTQIFNNPSSYQPITFFDDGTDFSSNVDVIDQWHQHYGQMRYNRRVCIKSAIIDKSNGNRSEEFINCSITSMGQRFGVAGEDDISSQDRDFDQSGFSFYWHGSNDDGEISTSMNAITGESDYGITQVNPDIVISSFGIGNNRAGFGVTDSVNTNTGAVNCTKDNAIINYSDSTDSANVITDVTGITLETSQFVLIPNVQDFANNAAAIAAGLPINALYRNGDNLCIVH